MSWAGAGARTKEGYGCIVDCGAGLVLAPGLGLGIELWLGLQ